MIIVRTNKDKLITDVYHITEMSEYDKLLLDYGNDTQFAINPIKVCAKIESLIDGKIQSMGVFGYSEYRVRALDTLTETEKQTIKHYAISERFV